MHHNCVYNLSHPAELLLLGALMEGKIYPELICSTKAIPMYTEEIIFHKAQMNLNKFTWGCTDPWINIPFLELDEDAAVSFTSVFLLYIGYCVMTVRRSGETENWLFPDI